MKLANRIFRRERGKNAEEYYVTSPFGWRKDPKTGAVSGHNGCDYGTHGNKWAQYALEDGHVEAFYVDNYGALCVRVAYPRLGIRLTHAHLDEVYVQSGQLVNEHSVLGKTGTTGYSTGIHLHLGMQRIGDSTWLDPESYDYQVEEKEEVKPVSLKFKVGDAVYIKGALYSNSNAAEATGYCDGKLTNITRVNPGSAHPYNTTGDLGWMDEASINVVEEKPTVAEINVGDSVIVNGVGKSNSTGAHGSKNTRHYVNHRMKVIKINRGANYPYGCNQYNTGNVGDTTKITAWFASDSVRKA